jgi:hypothetical protein
MYIYCSIPAAQYAFVLLYTMFEHRVMFLPFSHHQVVTFIIYETVLSDFFFATELHPASSLYVHG